jgi:hypothetical protein
VFLHMRVNTRPVSSFIKLERGDDRPESRHLAYAKLMIILGNVDPCNTHLHDLIQRFKSDYLNEYSTYLMCYSILRIVILNLIDYLYIIF